MTCGVSAAGPARNLLPLCQERRAARSATYIASWQLVQMAGPILLNSRSLSCYCSMAVWLVTVCCQNSWGSRLRGDLMRRAYYHIWLAAFDVCTLCKPQDGLRYALVLPTDPATGKMGMWGSMYHGLLYSVHQISSSNAWSLSSLPRQSVPG